LSQKSYELFLDNRIKAKFSHNKGYSRDHKNVKNADKVSKKQTLEPLAPRILGPSS
jgi:hypothetical protein